MTDPTTTTGPQCPPVPQCPPIPSELINEWYQRDKTYFDDIRTAAQWGFAQGLAAAQRLAEEERQCLPEQEPIARLMYWNYKGGAKIHVSTVARTYEEMPKGEAPYYDEGEPLYTFAAAQRLAAEERQRGADEELEACCAWLEENDMLKRAHNDLRASRRPKPPTLRKRALDIFKRLDMTPTSTATLGARFVSAADLRTIFQALEEAGDE